jgi:tetratricopeptide (TPR) repeat protein
VYLSAAERGVARVDLNTGATTYRRLPVGYEKNGVPLGTLLPAGGRLIACDKAATVAYAPFAETFEQRPPRSAEDHFRWGLLALGAREFEQARRDFTAALDKADARDDPALVRQAKARLYQTHLLLAGARADPAERLALLHKAASLAGSTRDAIETRLHLARALAAAGRSTEALDTAQSTVVDFPAAMIEAEFRTDATRAVPAGNLRDSHEVAQEIVAGIVARDRSAYGRWDAAAQADHRAALAAEPDERVDRLVRILRVYPHAAVADRVLHRLSIEHSAQAAAAVARSAGGDPVERREAELRALRLRAQAVKYLDRIVREYPGSSLRATALAGLVMLDALTPDSSGEYGRWCAARLAELPPDTPLESADGARRTVRDFLSRYGPTAGGGLELPADIPPDRTVVRLLAPEYSMLVRGVDGRPLTHAGKLFLLTPQGLELHDPAGGTTVWRAAAPAAAVPDPAAERAVRRRPVNARVALRGVVGPAPVPFAARARPPAAPSADGGGSHFAVGGITAVGEGAARREVLAVWDGRRVVTVDLKTGRLLWAGAEDSLVGSRPAADFYNGIFALALSGGPSSAALVDPARRATLRPSLTNAVTNDVAPALGPGGAVFASSFAAPNRSGFDLVEAAGGASAVRRDLDGNVQLLARSPSGTVLHLAGGRLSACDIDGRTIWTAGGTAGSTAVRLLHHDVETVIAAFADTERDFDRRQHLVCLDVGTGRVLWRSPGVQEAGVWAVRLGDRLIVLTSTESPSRPTAWALSTANSVRLTAHSVRDGKPLWTYTINEAAPGKPAIVFCRPIVTRTQVAVFVRSAEGGDGRLVRVAHETGKAAGQEAFACPAVPEIVAGHLVCDSLDGIRLYGKAGPLTRAVGRLVRAVERLGVAVP